MFHCILGLSLQMGRAGPKGGSGHVGVRCCVGGGRHAAGEAVLSRVGQSTHVSPCPEPGCWRGDERKLSHPQEGGCWLAVSGNSRGPLLASVMFQDVWRGTVGFSCLLSWPTVGLQVPDWKLEGQWAALGNVSRQWGVLHWASEPCEACDCNPALPPGGLTPVGEEGYGLRRGQPVALTMAAAAQEGQWQGGWPQAQAEVVVPEEGGLGEWRAEESPSNTPGACGTPGWGWKNASYLMKNKMRKKGSYRRLMECVHFNCWAAGSEEWSLYWGMLCHFITALEARWKTSVCASVPVFYLHVCICVLSVCLYLCFNTILWDGNNELKFGSCASWKGLGEY